MKVTIASIMMEE